MRRLRHLETWLALVFIPALTGVYFLALRIDRTAYTALLREDGLTEWCTSAALAAAALFSTGWARRERKAGRPAWFAILFAVFCALCALEEISWAQRLGGIRTPEFFLRHSDQREINVHNVVQRETGVRTTDLAALFLTAFGVVFPLLARWRVTAPVFRKWGMTAPPIAWIPAFLLAALVIREPYTDADEELGELLFAQLLAFFALRAWRKAPGDGGPGRAAQVAALLSLAGCLLLLGIVTAEGPLRKPQRLRDYLALQRAAWTLPAGQALVGDELAGWVGRGEDRIPTGRWDGSFDGLSGVFERAYPRDNARRKILLDALQGGFGVRYFDGQFLVLGRGATDPATELVTETLAHWPETLLVAQMARHGGTNAMLRGAGEARYWRGDGSRSPVNLAHGRSWPLEPGRYRAILRYRAETPRRTVRGSWGVLSLHRLGRPEAIAEAPLPETPARGPALQRFALEFELSDRTDVEPRITGMDAELWLYSLRAEPAGPAGGAVLSPR